MCICSYFSKVVDLNIYYLHFMPQLHVLLCIVLMLFAFVLFSLVSEMAYFVSGWL